MPCEPTGVIHYFAKASCEVAFRNDVIEAPHQFRNGGAKVTPGVGFGDGCGDGYGCAWPGFESASPRILHPDATSSILTPAQAGENMSNPGSNLPILRMILAAMAVFGLAGCFESNPQPSPEGTPTNRDPRFKSADASADAIHGPGTSDDASQMPDLEAERGDAHDTPGADTIEDLIADASLPDLPSPNDLKPDPPDAPDLQQKPDVKEPEFSQYFPLNYSMNQIEMVQEQQYPIFGQPYVGRLYRNNAYKCGKSGYFTFLTVEAVAATGQPKGLWVLLHGGGVGYFDVQGNYHGGEGALVEETAGDLLNEALAHIFDDDDDLMNTILAMRAADGYRFLLPSMCDHDLYGGMGNPHPHDPYWDGGDTVDGLVATMAAIDFTVNGYGQHPAHPSTHVFVHGTSAGSAGAYNVTHAFSRNGIRLTGGLLDSYLVSERSQALFGTGCTPSEDSDPNFDSDEVVAKVGAFVSEGGLFLENIISGPFAIPYFDLITTGDEYCCGDHTVGPVAVQAGYDNNCEYIHGLVVDAIHNLPKPNLHRALIIPLEDAHSISKSQGPWQPELEKWYQAILASNPPPPWPLP